LITPSPGYGRSDSTPMSTALPEYFTSYTLTLQNKRACVQTKRQGLLFFFFFFPNVPLQDKPRHSTSIVSQWQTQKEEMQYREGWGFGQTTGGELLYVHISSSTLCAQPPLRNHSIAQVGKDLKDHQVQPQPNHIALLLPLSSCLLIQH